jgi:hypothetical protein
MSASVSITILDFIHICIYSLIRRLIHEHFIIIYISISSKVVCSNSVHGKVYSIQQYVIKFVSDLWQVGGFLRVLLTILVWPFLAAVHNV